MGMSMNVLISDKSVPFAVSLAEALNSRNVPVALLAGELSVTSSIHEIPWNRPSVLSAKTVVLETKNLFTTLDQAVLIFDALHISGTSSAQSLGTSFVDDYIKGYLLLCAEIASLFTSQKKGHLVFVLRSRLNTVPNIPVAAAEGAFTALAEETVASFSGFEKNTVQTLLVRLEQSDDAQNTAWLVEQLEQRPNTRNQIRWIKSGSKGLFGLL